MTTPQEAADERIADPAWDFEANPTNAISDATTQAAEHALHGRPDRAAYWAETSARLSDAAGTEPGIVIAGMLELYGIDIAEVIDE